MATKCNEENCDNEATVHLTEFRDGVKHEMHLCESCAAAKNLPGKSHFSIQQLLAGKKVPKDIVLKTPTIEKKDLDAWLKVMPEGSVAVFPYSQSWTAQLIDAMAAGQPQPKDPPAQPGDM